MDEPMIPAPEDDDLRRDIELIFRVYRDLVFSIDQHLRECELGRLHYQLLLCIRRRPNETVSYYLSLMKLTKQSMSRLVRELLAHGLVEERTGTRDRRERFLLLTEKGVTLEHKLTATHGARFARLYGDAGADAVDRFRAILNMLLDRSPGAAARRDVTERAPLDLPLDPKILPSRQA